MANKQHYIYSIPGIIDFALTPKTLGPFRSWKYKRLWFRRFFNSEVDFCLLVEQSDIGFAYVFATSEALTERLYALGVKPRKEYEILSVEGKAEDLVKGKLCHLEREFTLEIKQDPHNNSYRLKMYPAAYNGMVQKRCLIRCSFEADPFDVATKPVELVYEGTEKDIPPTYRHVLNKKARPSA